MRIGYKALKGVAIDLGREFDGNSGKFDFEGAEALLYYGIKSGCELTGKEFDLSREEMENVLDESLDEFISAFTAFSQPPQQGATPGTL